MSNFITKHTICQVDCYIVWNRTYPVFATTYFPDIKTRFPDLHVKEDQLGQGHISSFQYKNLEEFVHLLGKRKFKLLLKSIFADGVVQKDYLAKGNTVLFDDLRAYGANTTLESHGVCILDAVSSNLFFIKTSNRWELCAIVSK